MNRCLVAVFSFIFGIACNADKPIEPGDDNTPAVSPEDSQDELDLPETPCEKFSDPKYILDQIPGEIVGSLSSENAIISVMEGDCLTEHAPYGVQGEGPETVLRVQNLIPGEEYLADMESEADLLFYIATGCTGGEGLSEDDCLSFVDASTGSREHEVFTAPDSGVIYVVVDYWKDDNPQNTEFRFNIGPADCSEDTPCEGSDTSHCLRGICVECIENSDCSFDFPFCTDSNICTIGYDECDSDDEREHGDDTSAWATDIQSNSAWISNDDGSHQAVFEGQICGSPYSDSNGSLERDYFKFTVLEPGEHWSVSLSWTDADADLDLYIVDSNWDNYFGMTYWKNPETIDLSFLPTGDYLIMVKQYVSGSSTASVNYTMVVDSLPAQSCTDTVDCALEYSTQYYRGECQLDGACGFIDGNGLVSLWESCDSDDDCNDDATLCTSFSFAAESHTRAVCSPSCNTNEDCGEGKVCTSDADGLYFCAFPCELDEHCGASVGQEATGSAPWIYPTCDVVSGLCNY